MTALPGKQQDFSSMYISALQLVQFGQPPARFLGKG
jgi:hypothetical protein